MKYALRSIARAPLFSMAVVSTIAVAIAANVSVFSVADAVLLRPLPVADADRVLVPVTMQGDDPFGVSAIDFETWTAARLRSIERLGLARADGFDLADGDDPERVSGAAVDAGFLATLGVAPALGRGFTAGDTAGAGAPLALISHGLWQRRYAGDTAILGREVRIDDRAHVVVGVMPPGFDVPLESDLWVPFSLDQVAPAARSAREHTVVARLRTGATRTQAEQELQALARDLEVREPATHLGWGVRTLSLREALLDDLDGRLSSNVWLLLAAVIVMLLVGCGNLSNLMLTRALERETEMAIRVSLGAGRGRLVRQLLGESAVLVLAGGCAGVLAASFVTPMLMRLSPIRTSALAGDLLDARLDLRVLAFAAAATALTGLLFAVLPALRFSRATALATLARATRATPRASVRRAMNVAVQLQIAGTLLLLVASATLVLGFARLQRMPLGFRPEGLTTVQLNLRPGQYAQPAQRHAFVDRLLTRVRALPGVTAAGVSTNLPADHMSIDAVYECEGRPPAASGEVLLTADRLVSPGYLETIGATLRAGRLIAPGDTAASAPVVVVTEDLARQCFPGQDALGRRVRRASRSGNARWMTIVGVVASVREDRAAFRRERPAWYVPYQQVNAQRTLHLVVRADRDQTAVAAAIRGELRAIDPAQTATPPELVTVRVAELVNPDRFAAFLTTVFSGLGMLLALLGVFGLTAYAARQRAQEFRIRVALGATTRDIVALVVSHAARVALSGALVGVAGAIAASRAIARFVFDAPVVPVVAVLALALALVSAAVAAALLPARRAARDRAFASIGA